MKINSNITKLQQGGLTPPFVSWDPIPDTPVASVSSAPTSNTSSSGASDPLGGLLSKDMTKLLMENGLPSDVEALTNSISTLYNDPIYRVTGELNTAGLSSRYLNIISSLNRIKYNKELYDNEVERLTKNGGLSDVAITNLGRIVAQDLDNGSIIQITPEEYQEGNYRAVTNGELAKLRAINPNMAFDNNAFQVLNNGISQSDIQSYIDAAVKDLGTSTTSTSDYIAAKGKDLLNGLNQLINNPEVKSAIVSDGVYKITQEQSSNVKQATKALNYLYSSLPENAKNYLRAKAAINGLDPSKGAYQILANAIEAKLSDSSEFSIDYDASASKAAGLGKESSTTGTVAPTQDRRLMEGLVSGSEFMPYTLNSGTQWEFSTEAIVDPALLNFNGTEPIGTSRMDKVLSDSTLSLGLKNSMYFGSKKVNMSDLTRMVFDGGQLAYAYVPVKRDNNGDIVPDIESLEKIQKAEQKIKELKRTNPAMTGMEEKKIYSDFGVREYYGIYDPEKGQGLVSMRLVKPFFMVNATAVNDDKTGANFDNPYVHKVNNQKEEANKIANYLTEGTGFKDNEIDTRNQLWGLGFWDWTDHIYKGTFFIEAPGKVTAQGVRGQALIPKSSNLVENLYKNEMEKSINQGGWAQYGNE